MIQTSTMVGEGFLSPQEELFPFTFGTLIVPRLASLINVYRGLLYKANPSANGQGYFIRPEVLLPEAIRDKRRYGALDDGIFIPKIFI